MEHIADLFDSYVALAQPDEPGYHEDTICYRLPTLPLWRKLRNMVWTKEGANGIRIRDTGRKEFDAVALRRMHLGTSAERVSLNKATLFQERLLDDILNIQA